MNNIPGIKTKRIQQVEERGYGAYLWELPDGTPLMDDDYNFLSINAEWGDLQAMAKLSAAARYWGFPDGKPRFVKGTKMNDEDYFEYINRGDDV